MKDWYCENGLLANSTEECAQIFLNNKNNSDIVFIKYNIDNAKEFEEKFGNAILKSNKLNQQEMNALRYGCVNGMSFFKFEK